ncbi:MAG: 4-hydroxy-tetrahydrodipicolinate synthase [Verrucomicrobiae bacterium]|jgi:4-hydroxy-tetrahydrodipicolinate synthase|nr:4-hydroxy-tetrahydrodipicolinate synthase [Verrucomicrobiae bacterium]
MKEYPSFAGVHTALVTPFCNAQFDEATFIKLIERQIEAGITGIVPVGSTGESPTLSHPEQLRVIDLAIKTARNANRKILVTAGTGSNSTAKAIESTQEAERLGADAAMLVLPYYNKPSAEGIYAHFKAIAESVKIPIIIYDAPGRCGISLPLSIAVRLANDCPNIIGIKDCNASLEHIEKLHSQLPPHFQLLSGDDIWTLPFLRIGAVGVISVASNLLPVSIVKLVSLFELGLLEEAQELHLNLIPLFKDLFIETNPVPIKTAMALRGLLQEEFRLPLVSLTNEHREILFQRVESYSLE